MKLQFSHIARVLAINAARDSSGLCIPSARCAASRFTFAVSLSIQLAAVTGSNSLLRVGIWSRDFEERMRDCERLGPKTHINISVIPRHWLNPPKLSGFRLLGHEKRKKFCIWTFQCIYVFQTILITNRDCFSPNNLTEFILPVKKPSDHYAVETEYLGAFPKLRKATISSVTL